MKNKYILFTLASIFCSTFVSNSQKLIQENRIWEYKLDRYNTSVISQYCFDGVVECQGKIYHKWKLIKTIESNNNEVFSETLLYTTEALLREEDGKVYMLLDNNAIRKYNEHSKTLSAKETIDPVEEVVLYDFNIKDGESYTGLVNIKWCDENFEDQEAIISQLQVVDEAPLQLSNQTTRQYKLTSIVHADFLDSIEALADFYQKSIDERDAQSVILSCDGKYDNEDQLDSPIEYGEIVGNIGQGTLTQLISPKAIFLISGFTNWTNQSLYKVYDLSGEIIYESKAASIDNITGNCIEKDDNMQLYNLNGLKISHPEEKSIYIRSGKKYVMK